SQATLAEFAKTGLLEKHMKRMIKIYSRRLDAMEKCLERHLPAGLEWTRPEGGMSVWITLPPGLDAGELLIHARERGVLFIPGRYFFVQDPQPNTLRLGFAGVEEKDIARGILTLGQVIESELKKKARGAGRRVVADDERGAASSRVALI
ncbi:MAG: aminotransferase class I/II-fold pyridoxal phosphate-dependent enzyme, partial [Candidatus Acidiferrales bacterium]